MRSPLDLLAKEIKVFIFCVPCPEDNIIGHEKPPQKGFFLIFKILLLYSKLTLFPIFLERGILVDKTPGDS
jgi:hypothetical protein